MGKVRGVRNFGKPDAPAVRDVVVHKPAAAEAAEEADDDMGVAGTVSLSRPRSTNAKALRKTIDKNSMRGASAMIVDTEAGPSLQKPSSRAGVPKSGRVWKEVESSRSSARVKKPPVGRSWAEKEVKRAELAEVKAQTRQLREEAQAEREEEKRKAAQRKQIKEENRKKSLIVTEIKDTRKIKRMSKKQLKNIMTR